MRSVENAECGKCVENYIFHFNFHSHAEKQYRDTCSHKHPFNENIQELKEQCHEEFAVLGTFCAKITTCLIKNFVTYHT